MHGINNFLQEWILSCDYQNIMAIEIIVAQPSDVEYKVGINGYGSCDRCGTAVHGRFVLVLHPELGLLAIYGSTILPIQHDGIYNGSCRGINTDLVYVAAVVPGQSEDYLWAASIPWSSKYVSDC